MPNYPLTSLLRSAESARKHGRHATADRKQALADELMRKHFPALLDAAKDALAALDDSNDRLAAGGATSLYGEANNLREVIGLIEGGTQ